MAITVKRHRGIAGQYALSVDTPDGTLQFVGSTYGGPVVMISPSGAQVFVSDPGRFGEFGEDWVRNFLKGCGA